MTGNLRTWVALLADRRGVTSLDYGLIAGVLALAAVAEAGLVAFGMH